MSLLRIIPLNASMDVQQLQQCAWRASAIVGLCRHVADNLPFDKPSVDIGSDIHQALSMAHELLGFIGDHFANLDRKGDPDGNH